MRSVLPAAWLEPLENRRLLSAGSLDPTFGVGGIVRETFKGTPNGIAIEADGHILVTDATQLLCFNADGTPDASFGNGGAVTPNFTVAGLALQSGGKIVLGGSARGGWAVARYNANGTPDTTFGAGASGQTITHVNSSTGESAVGVGIEADGDIVVGGTQVGPGPIPLGGTPSNELVVVAFNGAGAIDASFATDGSAATPAVYGYGAEYSAQALTVAPDGDIIVGGLFTENILFVWDALYSLYSPEGALLQSPSVDGLTGDYISAAATLADGTPAFAINSGGTAKLNTGASGLPEEFGFNPALGAAGTSTPAAIARLANNQIIVAGHADGLGLARFNADGTLDSSFGLGGTVDAHPAALPHSGSLQAVTEDSSGDVLTAGVTGGRGAAGGLVFLARFLGGSNAPGTETPAAYFDPNSIAPALRRRHYTFNVYYGAQQSIDTNTLTNNSVFLTRPRGFSEAATVVRFTTTGGSTEVTYGIDADASGFPTGTQDFDIVLARRSVRDNFGNAVPGGVHGSVREKLR